MKDAKENLGENELVVILNFSENYSFVVQDEVQGWYWPKNQCTINPFVVYFKDSSNLLSHLSLIMISKCLKHTFAAVNLFQQKLITFLKTKFTIIKKILFFSDGAGSQYKSKYNIYNLCPFNKLYGCMAQWHFFATSYDKGPCDGIGGTLKKLAAKASLQKPLNNKILTAKDIYDWAKSGQSAMHYEYCTNDEYNKSTEHIEKYKNVKGVAGIQGYQAFIPFNENNIYCKVTTFSNEKQIFKLT